MFTGAVVGIGVLFLTTAFWRALAYDSNVSWFADTIQWWDAAMAVVALFVAGLLAGWVSGRRGWTSGLLNGLTVWGLVLAASTVVAGVGPAVSILTLLQASQEIGGTNNAIWAAFAAYGIGMVAAVFGGSIGGGLPRPAGLDTATVEEVDLRDRDRAPAEDEAVSATR